MNIVINSQFFSVSKIETSEVPQLGEALSSWKKEAAIKEFRAQTSDEKDRFSSCVGRCDDLKVSISRIDGQEFYTCRDQKGLIQAVMEIYICQNALNIETLVTHPHNIRTISALPSIKRNPIGLRGREVL